MLEVRLSNCSGENAGVGTILVEPQEQTPASALFCLINAPYLLAAFAGSIGFLVWWFCYIGLETLSCQGTWPGGTGRLQEFWRTEGEAIIPARSLRAH